MNDSYIYDLDKKILLYFNNQHLESLDILMFSYRNCFLWTLLALVLIFVLQNFSTNKKRHKGFRKLVVLIWLVATQAVLCTIILPYFFSFLQQVPRPVYNEDFSYIASFSKFEFDTREIFFAARVCAVTTITIFFILFKETPVWLKGIFLVLVLLAVFNRMYIGAYYPSSLFMSLMLGAGLGLYSYRYYLHLKKTVIRC